MDGAATASAGGGAVGATATGGVSGRLVSVVLGDGSPEAARSGTARGDAATGGAPDGGAAGPAAGDRPAPVLQAAHARAQATTLPIARCRRGPTIPAGIADGVVRRQRFRYPRLRPGRD